jgi:hypothetical protein
VFDIAVAGLNLVLFFFLGLDWSKRPGVGAIRRSNGIDRDTVFHGRLLRRLFGRLTAYPLLSSSSCAFSFIHTYTYISHYLSLGCLVFSLIFFLLHPVYIAVLGDPISHGVWQVGQGGR